MLSWRQQATICRPSSRMCAWSRCAMRTGGTLQIEGGPLAPQLRPELASPVLRESVQGPATMSAQAWVPPALPKGLQCEAELCPMPMQKERSLRGGMQRTTLATYVLH